MFRSTHEVMLSKTSACIHQQHCFLWQLRRWTTTALQIQILHHQRWFSKLVHFQDVTKSSWRIWSQSGLFSSPPVSPPVTNDELISRPNVIQNPVHRPVPKKISQPSVAQVGPPVAPIQPAPIPSYSLLHEFWRRSSALSVTAGGIWVPPQPNHAVAPAAQVDSQRPCSPTHPSACPPVPAFGAAASPPFGTTFASAIYSSTTPTKPSFFAAQPQTLLPIALNPPPLATSPTAFQAASSTSLQRTQPIQTQRVSIINVVNNNKKRWISFSTTNMSVI